MASRRRPARPGRAPARARAAALAPALARARRAGTLAARPASGPRWRPFARVASLAAALLAALPACPSSPPLDDPASRAVRETQLPDGRIQLALALDDQGVEREALLEEVGRPQGGGAPRVLRVLRHEPPGGSLGWLFGLVPPGFDLELEGRAEPHPDRKTGADLLRLLDARPPALEAALAGLARLHRVEPRAAIIEKAARLPALAPEQLDRLVAIASAGRAGPLEAAGPGGAVVGGSRADALALVLGALAARPDLGGARATRLAETAPAIHRDAAEAAILLALVQRGADPRALLRAHEALDEEGGARPRQRRDLLVALAQREGLVRDDLDAIAAASQGIGNDAYEAELLRALALAGASVEALVAAAEAIDGPTGARERSALYLALCERPGLLPADADRLALAAPRGGAGAEGASVLERLIAKGLGSTDALLEALSDLEVPGEPAEARARLLLEMVRRRGREADDADRIARGVGVLEDDESEARALLALVREGQVSAAAALEGLRAIADASAAPSMRRDVLLALVGLRGAERADADRIAGDVERLDEPGYAAEVLLALLGRGQVSTDALCDAALAIDGSSAAPAQRHRVLLALAEKRGGAKADADEVADSSAGIEDDGLEAHLLLALIRKGEVSTDEAIDACGGFGDASSRAKLRGEVLLALARARATRRDDAEAIAAATPAIEDDRLEMEVLVLLAKGGEAAVEDVLDAAEGIDVRRSSPQYLQLVLEALARRARLDEADADRIARAAPRLGSDALEAAVLILLARRASPAALDEALREVRSPDEARKVEAALGR